MNDPIEYRGARFYKCALQVNPYDYGERFRGEAPINEEIYNQDILKACKGNRIAVVGLADHGNVSTSEVLRNYLQKNGIVVFPGFEISSSEKIHMVCLYPEQTDRDQLNRYLGVLMDSNSRPLLKDRTYPSSLSCEVIAKKIINDQGGFWYAAHIIGKNGLLRLSGAGDNFLHLWKKDNLVIAAQIPGTTDDLDVPNSQLQKYKNILENKNIDYKREKKISIINAQDIHKPEQLLESSASCRIKMTKANFQAFKDAFKDPESRIRSNYEISKNPISAIKSIRWEGAGLFNSQKLRFSSNLNAIIGGRGTGKSTLIESIRFVLDSKIPHQQSQSAQNIQENNLQNARVELVVRCESQHGEHYIISRRFGERPIVKNENEEISHMTPQDLLPGIEVIGQNEILNIQQNEENKLILLESFLPDTEIFTTNMRDLKRKLSINRKNIIAETDKFEALEQEINQEGKLKEKEEQYKTLGIADKLKDSDLLERESQIKNRIEDQLRYVKEWLDEYESIFDLSFLEDASISVLPNAGIISEVRDSLNQLKVFLDNLVGIGKKSLQKVKLKHASQKEDWQVRESKLRDKIDQAIANLPDQKGKSGKQIGSHYQEIINHISAIERYKLKYEKQKSLISALESERCTLLEEYRSVAFERYNTMQNEMVRLNKNELYKKMKINIERCKNFSALRDFMQNLDGIGPAKIKWLDKIERSIDLIQWSQWIKDQKKNHFREKYQELGLTDATIDRLLAINLESRLKLEEIELKDVVEISLNVAHEKEGDRYMSIENLSIGQKCTAILNLLLIKLDDPLIIDQPEDHLDNAFIAERIVSELRNLKTKRQFLFATHNANIPVFGDAELIVVLEHNGSKAVIKNVGSIDDKDIRDQAAQILEGGKAAFDMRKEKYGFE